MRASGSAPWIAESNPRSSSRYLLASGAGFQKRGVFGSFQACQSTIGSSGSSGWSFQKVPFEP